MKIFSPLSILFPPPMEATEDSSTSGLNPGEDWLLWPDSCWILSNRPVFIPDFDESFFGIPALAGKIGRIGKTIAPGFAHRYISELTASILLMPDKAIKALELRNAPSANQICFDNAVILGDWVNIRDSFDWNDELDMKLEENNAGQNQSQSCDALLNLDMKVSPSKLYPTVADASRRHTLKMGDVILYPLPEYKFRLRENENIRVSLPALSSAPALTTRFR